VLAPLCGAGPQRPMSSRIDIGLLRFVRARTDETHVLNPARAARVNAAPDLSGRLVTAAISVRTIWSSSSGSVADHKRPALPSARAAYRSVSQELAAFDPGTLRTREQRLAFWINVYNALAVDAVIAFAVQESIREQPGFFRRAAYEVGGQRISAEAIEHGILRDNQPPLPRLDPPFGLDDPRRSLCVSPTDPRAHFALNCATLSCPTLRVYSAECIGEELDDAARDFIRGGGVSVESDQVRVSALFQLYADDFGGPEGIARWITRYVPDAEEAELVRDAFARGTAVYEPYDWHLDREDGPAEDP
jgi:Protein of unknown function, DUF547